LTTGLSPTQAQLAASGGGSFSANGSTVSSPNINSLTTPSTADSGYTAGTVKDLRSNFIVEVPNSITGLITEGIP